MRRFWRCSAAALAFSAIFGTSVFAAEEQTKKDKAEPKLLDLVVPTDVPKAPALYMLGLTSATTVPSTAPDLGLNLLNGVDPFGNFQTGIALDSAPYILLRGDKITLEEYQDSLWQRTLWSTGFSFATTKGVNDDDKATRVGLALKMTPYDGSDIRQDGPLLAAMRGVYGKAECMEAKIESNWKRAHGSPTTPPPECSANADDSEKWFEQLPNETQEKFRKSKEAELQAKQDLEKALLQNDPGTKLESLEKIREQKATAFISIFNTTVNTNINAVIKDKSFKTNQWYKSSVTFGGGPTFSSEDGSIFSLGDAGGGGFLSASYGMPLASSEKKEKDDDLGVQIVGTARYLANQLVPKTKKSSDDLINQDSWLIGTRLRLGWEWLNFYGEAGYFDTSSRKQDDDHYWQIGFGGDVRLFQSVYLSLGLGGTLGRQGEEDTFLLSNLKWQWSRDPAFKPSASN